MDALNNHAPSGIVTTVVANLEIGCWPWRFEHMAQTTTSETENLLDPPTPDTCRIYARPFLASPASLRVAYTVAASKRRET